MQDINYWAIIGVTILQIILGMIWYGKPLFGGLWVKISGLTEADMQKAKGKSVGSLYAFQMLMSLISNAVLYYVLNNFVLGDKTFICVAFILWLGFVVPLSGGGVLWEKLSNEYKWKKFLLTAGYQLIAMLVAAWIFSIY